MSRMVLALRIWICCPPLLGGLNVIQLHFDIGGLRVDENRYRRSVGSQLTEQLHALRLHLRLESAYASDVAAGAMQIGDEAAPDRVGAENGDDRYGRGRRLRCQSRPRRVNASE
jgi:hypothetical protein